MLSDIEDDGKILENVAADNAATEQIRI